MTVLGTLALTTIAPARAQVSTTQSIDELKALVLKLQQRVDQLESAQHRVPPPDRRTGQAARPANPAPSSAQTSSAQTSSTQTRAAQQAAIQAQQSAMQAQEAASQAQAAGLRAQQEAQLSKESTAADIKAAYAPPKGKPPGSFRIPGTETVVRIYGFVKLNATSDLTTQDQSDALSAQSIPLFGTGAARQGGDTQMSARRSRFDVETWSPVNETFGEFHTLMEMDFAGQNTSLTTQSTANGYTPRLRKFYGDFGRPVGGWGAVLFGQENSVYSDNSLLPIQWLNDATFVGVSNIRQAQIRYTYGFDGGVAVAIGVESPYSDITTATGTSYPDANGGAGVGWQDTPDFTGRLLWKQKWGLVALRGVARPQINLNNNGAATASARFNESTAGYGIGLTGVLNVLDGQLVLMASGNAGNGLGRYLDATSNGYSAVSNSGIAGVTTQSTSINAVGVYGGMVGAQYFFTPAIRTNMSLGGARLMLPSYVAQFGGCVNAAITTGTCSATNTAVWVGSVNLIWSPFKALDVGLEYTHAERNLQQAFASGPGASTTGGIQNRVQVSLIGRF